MMMILCIIKLIISLGAWFYYYEPGVVVDSSGGGHKIPLPPEFGQ